MAGTLQKLRIVEVPRMNGYIDEGTRKLIENAIEAARLTLRKIKRTENNNQQRYNQIAEGVMAIFEEREDFISWMIWFVLKREVWNEKEEKK